MTNSHFLLFLAQCLAVFRLTWFIVHDKLWEGTRQRLLDFLGAPSTGEDGSIRPKRDLMKGKLWDLIQCPWCVSAYVSAGVLFAYRLLVAPVPVPVLWWLGIWGGGLVIINLFDDE